MILTHRSRTHRWKKECTKGEGNTVLDTVVGGGGGEKKREREKGNERTSSFGPPYIAVNLVPYKGVCLTLPSLRAARFFQFFFDLIWEDDCHLP